MKAKTRDKPIPQAKIDTVNELKDLSKNKKTVLVASIKNIPGSQFQEIVKKLRGKSIVKVPKKNLLFNALNSLKKTNENVEKLKGQIDESFAMLFSDMDAFELATELIESQTLTKAKVGQETPEDVEVPAGPTELTPGPAISDLGAMGIKIQIEGGKINIQESKIIAKAGEEISQGAADLMSKLDIKPFKVGFIPLCALDNENKIFYSEIKIDKEGTLEALKNAYGKALPFATDIGYICQETLKIMIQKAGAYEKKLIRVITGEPEPEQVVEEKPKEEAPKEEPKEEKKEATAEGLGALFG